MAYPCEWVRKNLGKETPSEPFPCEWVKKHWEDEVWEAPYPCEAIEQYAESLRTVLYEDGTFIINERGADVGANVKKHGEASYVYPPLDSEHDYVFATSDDRYWSAESALIKSVEFGSSVQPTSMRSWFRVCNNLETFDTINLDTSKCVNFRQLFQGTTTVPLDKLTSIDFSSLNTSKVEDMSFMFNQCTVLESVNLSGIDTSSVTNMSQMFGNCSSLTSLDLSTFDTSNVTTMQYMFTGCNSLTNLDLSSFDTSCVTDMGTMFRDCTNLQTIYVSNLFDVTNVTNGSGMFGNCTSIVGGAGTTYVNTTAGKSVTYARIDNPPDAPGYFTEK